MSQTEKSLKQTQEQLADIKANSVEQRQKIGKVEKDLLEMEFELTELESEKHTKTHDAKVQ